jgi:cytochrome c-type biogenesis protein CcmH/NrfG
MANRRIEPLKKVLAIDPNDEVAWFGLGKAYMEDANFEEAAKALQQCVIVKPTYSVCATGIDISTTNGDMMVTKSLEMLRGNLG